MRDLIRQGLSAGNLRELYRLAKQLFHQKPILYGSLLFIFRALGDGYEALDAVDTARFNEVNQALQEPLLYALDAEDDAPTELMDRLNMLHKEFFILQAHRAPRLACGGFQAMYDKEAAS